MTPSNRGKVDSVSQSQKKLPQKSKSAPDNHEQDPQGATETPVFKRRRVGLACTSCRNRKSRCNGDRPSCSQCVELGFECNYEQPVAAVSTARQEPVPSTTYDNRLRAIEETLQLLLEQQRSNTSARNGDSAKVMAEPHAAREENVVVINEDDNESIHSDSNHEIVDGMGVYPDPEESDTRFFGPSSNISFLRSISAATSNTLQALNLWSSSVEANRDKRRSLIALTRPPSPSLTVHTTVSTTLNDTARSIQALPPESRVLQLLQLFFSDTGMLFPFIHYENVLNTYISLKQNDFIGVRRSWLCLLNTILAFSAYISARPNESAEQNANESAVFFDRAWKLSEKFDRRRPTLEMVQSLLLMNQYRQGTQRSDRVSDLHGLTLSTAVQLGLQCRSSLSGMSAVAAETRKRTFFALFILDRTLSMTLGRPPAVPNSYVALDMPVIQSLEEIDSGKLFSTDESTVWLFSVTIDLYLILGDIISDLYGQNLNLEVSLSLAEIVEKTFSLEQRLTAWKNNLPLCLKKEPWKNSQPTPRSAATPLPDSQVFDRLSVIVTLRYLNVRLLLHRPILNYFLHHSAAHADRRASFHHFSMQIAKQSLVLCETSASELVGIVHGMGSDAAFLPAWWFTAYYTFNAALVLFASLVVRVQRGNEEIFSSGPASIRVNGGLSAPLSGSHSHTLNDILLSLQHAIEISQKLGAGTMSSKRVGKSLEKLLPIATMLVQKGLSAGAASLSVDSSSASKAIPYANDSAMIQSMQNPQIPISTALPAIQQVNTFDDTLLMNSTFPQPSGLGHFDNQWMINQDFHEIFGNLEWVESDFGLFQQP